MRRVVVRAEHLARGENLNRRLLLFHHVNLPRRGLGAEQELIAQIKSILHVARRVVLRRVERGEVVVIRLDLRALVNLKAHARKGFDHLISDQRVRVEIAARNFRARQRDINLLCLVAVI